MPVPIELGVPLVWKMLHGQGGDHSHIRLNLIVRLMSDPDDGFAPCEWQYGGNMGPAPPVILARRDRIPFSCHDWMVLDDYMSRWRDELCEAEEGRAELNA